MADFILGAIPENDTGQDQATDQAAVLPTASSRAASDPPTSVYASKTKSQALELQKTQPQALCFPIDDDNIIFNGKEWGVKPIMFGNIYELRNNSTSDNVKTFLGISPTNTWEVLRRKIANGYPVYSEDEIGHTVKLIVNTTPNHLSIYCFEEGDTNLVLVGISYESSSGNFRATSSAILLDGAITQSDVIDDLYSEGSTAYPLSANMGSWLMNNKAGVITTHGLLAAIGNSSGQIQINVTSYFGISFIDLVSKIVDEGCVFISDVDTDNNVFTSGTLQYTESDRRVLASFDMVSPSLTPMRKFLYLERFSIYTSDITCERVYNYAY